jgi:hypothetical protein
MYVMTVALWQQQCPFFACKIAKMAVISLPIVPTFSAWEHMGHEIESGKGIGRVVQ